MVITCKPVVHDIREAIEVSKEPPVPFAYPPVVAELLGPLVFGRDGFAVEVLDKPLLELARLLRGGSPKRECRYQIE